MFNYRLTRLPFAILAYGHTWWEFYQLKQNEEIGLLLVLASLAFLLVFVVWPRLRDCDWPLWMGFLLLVPYLGSLIGLALLFAPSKVFNRRDEAEAKAAAEAAAGMGQSGKLRVAPVPSAGPRSSWPRRG